MEDIELDFGAITIDNSILKGEGYRFNEGRLKQMAQFANSPVRVIQSDIIHNEAKKHIADEIKNARSNIKKVLRSASNQLEISKKNIEVAIELLSVDGEELEIAEERLKKYYAQIGAEILESKVYIDFERLIKLYFATKAPFEEKKDKKSEFPDAIALISLENWAEKNGLNLIAVSADKGWKTFANNSARIKVIDNLTDAMAVFQPHNQVHNIIEHIREVSFFDGENHISKQIEKAIIDSLVADNIYVVASSDRDFQVRYIDVDYIEHELEVDKTGLASINIVRIDKNLIVLQVKADVNCKVMASFDFDAIRWSENDGENSGSLEVSLEETYSTDVLISLIGNFDEGLKSLSVSDIEIVDTLEKVDFGEIWPEYRNNYEE